MISFVVFERIIYGYVHNICASIIYTSELYLEMKITTLLIDD